ncbi:energy transducer TonB [Sphingobium sp. Sx8-8]|uniref:energy transducer TonB n=1 Tax=Sphingobium sp. Sx8-8 TaxID=2933617 RepID=UPI001F5957C9|nr:energy transducer TonB [Sphingobium sp. Sx8-8]
MLHVADRLAGEDIRQPGSGSPRGKLSLVAAGVDTGREASGREPTPSRYGDRRSVNWPAVLLILLVHGLLIAVLVQARQHVLHVRETRLSVVNLAPPPPPPPAAETPPPPSQPRVVAPPPLVQVPLPPLSPVATTPDPAPAPVLAAPVAPASATPVAAVAGPSNIVQGGDIGTQMVAGKPPRYPVESRRRHEQGTVVLTLTLGLDGAVESLAVTQSSGFSRLDQAARDAVRGWRWRPMIRDGQPVRVRGVVEIPFVLSGASA